jgi:hypothetical protein
MLCKCDRIIVGVNAQVKRVAHKYGIEIPFTVNKEMSNLKVAFDILEENENIPPGWTKASGHMVFEVQMTLERKARLVKDEH